MSDHLCLLYFVVARVHFLPESQNAIFSSTFLTFQIQASEMQKTAWLRGFLPKYLFGFPRMGRPYKKDAWGRLALKKASIYAVFRVFKTPSKQLLQKRCHIFVTKKR
ncbi:hypothetical protein [Acutalibacter muris]|uniref:hypothetical protein n=1 Tax=Acutalibacter muris TaxID=1796620 RepID=UPI001C3EF08F|nr:hypothetical protein [Acutalibacter muris]